VHVPGGGSFPQTAGLEIDFDAKKKSFKKLVVANKKLDPKKIYKIALPSFIAGGGDKWPNLKHKSPKVYGFTDAAVLREYFETNRPLPIVSQKKRVLVRY
jgi:5'-nucleotidase/UDP-sugar diphosphatase